MKIKFMLAALLLLLSCGEKDTLSGQWIQPIPGTENRFQGMMLMKNGEARSINMSTLLYDTWKKDGDKLVLTGKSIGNGQTISFEETYTIKQSAADTLILDNGSGGELVYKRKE